MQEQDVFLHIFKHETSIFYGGHQLVIHLICSPFLDEIPLQLELPSYRPFRLSWLISLLLLERLDY